MLDTGRSDMCVRVASSPSLVAEVVLLMADNDRAGGNMQAPWASSLIDAPWAPSPASANRERRWPTGSEEREPEKSTLDSPPTLP